MENLLNQLSNKKHRLDRYRPLPAALVQNLSEWLRVELTYTSNAIEGNTLTRLETALVIEKGLTVEGKTLKEQLEATNHAAALDFVNQLSQKERHDLTTDDLLTIHRLILHGIDDASAGRFRNLPVRIAGSATVLPNYAKVPELMTEFMAWLRADSPHHDVDIAAEAHYRLVSIHPFIDGNGRTARLLMNLLLVQAGYPLAIIRPEERRAYLTALEKGQTTGDTTDYYQLIYEAVDRSLDIYLAAVENKPDAPVASRVASETAVAGERPAAGLSGTQLVNRQTLAELTGVRASTIAYYADLSLLPYQQAGPRLARRFDPELAGERLRRIAALRAEGLSIEAIVEQFRQASAKRREAA